MAWTLNIHTIDVGQGDSSLIHAVDPATPTERSLLIDGGNFNCAEIVHRYLLVQQVTSLDVMLVTHSDADHYGGLMNLLRADNLWHLADTFAGVAAPEAKGKAKPQQLAATTAALVAAAQGAVGNDSTDAQAPAREARNGVPDKASDAAAIDYGIREATLGAEDYYGAGRVLPEGSKRVSPMATAGAYAAAKAIARQATSDEVKAAIRKAVRTSLYGMLGDTSPKFNTGGAYGNVVVIDNGGYLAPAGWASVVAGQINDGNYWIPTLGTARTRVTAALGAEVLFNANPNAPLLPPAAAPTATVVAAADWAWQGIGRPSAAIASGQPKNDQSISLAVRFDSFSFLTSGDQLSEGEQPISRAITQFPLPNPNPPPGSTYPQIQELSYAKCSHHGGAGSTSGPYLRRVKPKGVAISAGNNFTFKHPSQVVVTRLDDNADVAVFYLTNCNFTSPEIPASNALPQIGAGAAAGNKSRVCGDNNQINLAPGRSRGDIHLSITEAQADANVHQYTVTYHEEDLPVPGPNSETWTY